jgi:hypothetical protein
MGGGMTTTWVEQPDAGAMRIQFRCDSIRITVDENTNTADATMYDIPHPTRWIILPISTDPPVIINPSSVFVGVLT